MIQFTSSRLSALVVVLLWCASLAAAQETQQAVPAGDQAGPLHIQVTAVQGGAQYRNDLKSKWQAVTVGLQPDEGVEFRTGPRGSVQFTVGDDQIFRVDRLSVVKVLRANLMPDGMIRTDVGMTYGRVSKDVDAPSHPHSDTIVTPVSTLAVRGTYVAVYDSPPFEPEATSLTGHAIWKNARGLNISMGGPGSGTAKVSGDALGAAGLLLNTTTVNPNGVFAGQTAPEIQTINTQPGRPPIGPGGLPQSSQLTGGMTIMQQQINPMPTGPVLTGILIFDLSWSGPVSNSIVDLLVNGPGVAVSTANPPQVSSTAGPNVVGSRTAGTDGTGTVGIEFGSFAGSPFHNGTYKVTELLEGTTSSPNSPSAAGTITTSVGAAQTFNSEANPFQTASGTGVLNGGNQNIIFNVSVPITGSSSIVAVSGGGTVQIDVSPSRSGRPR